MSDFLVGPRSLAPAALHAIAEDCLSEDGANLIASAHGEFEFISGEVPAKGFDPDEASLRLSLAVQPLLFEAAKRSDHWAEIRKFLPTDSLHFQARGGARL